MKNSFETSFINQAVEKTPFADTPAQNFFAEWCKINDSIVPQFISREAWKKRGAQGILEKNDQGKQALLLPYDLHLWEMLDVIRTVDHDTLARSPEKREERVEKINELGKIFEKAGLYLSEYLPDFQENDAQAKKIAEEIAREFYQYGLALQHKERKNDDIPQESRLSQADKTKLDEWFLGRDVHQKKLSKLGDDPTEEQIEKTRKKILQTYFKALAREGYKADGERPWKTKVGPIQNLQDRTKKQITKAIENPEREMKTAIFRRGVEKLVTDMKEVGWRKAVNVFLKIVGFDPMLEQRRLYDTLRIDELKQDLAAVKQTGDVAKISTKELEIAKRIQRAVSSFPYKSYDKDTKEIVGNNPSKMVETQFINCVGSSILGGGLLAEVGINYLHADLPKHSATVLVTSDGKLRWQDFTPGGAVWNYKEIHDKDITGKNKHGKALTTADIIEFANYPADEGIRFEINRWWYNLNMEKINMPSRYIGLFNPEIGLQCHILNNTGTALNALGNYEESMEAFKQAISVDPKYAYPYNGLGNALRNLGRNEEAIEAYRQATNVDPKFDIAYYNLYFLHKKMGRKKEAVKILKEHNWNYQKRK